MTCHFCIVVSGYVSRVPPTIAQGGDEVSHGRRAILILKIAVAVSVLIWLAKSGHLNFGILKSASTHWPWFIAAQVIFGVVQLMTALRWRWLLDIVGVPCTFRRAFQLTLSGLLFNQVLIGSTGGDVYRVMAFKTSQRGERTAVFISVVADRFVGLFALIVLIPIAAMWNYSSIRQSTLLSAVAIGLSMVTIITPLVLLRVYRRNARRNEPHSRHDRGSRRARWASYVDEWSSCFFGNPRIVVKSLLISLVIQTLVVTVNVFLAFSILGTDIFWQAFYFLIPIALLGMAIPINPPGALGTGEAMYVYLLEFASVAQGGIISLLQRATNILWALLGLVTFFAPTREGPSSNNAIICEKTNGS